MSWFSQLWGGRDKHAAFAAGVPKLTAEVVTFQARVDAIEDAMGHVDFWRPDPWAARAEQSPALIFVTAASQDCKDCRESHCVFVEREGPIRCVLCDDAATARAAKDKHFVNLSLRGGA